MVHLSTLVLPQCKPTKLEKCIFIFSKHVLKINALKKIYIYKHLLYILFSDQQSTIYIFLSLLSFILVRIFFLNLFLKIILPVVKGISINAAVLQTNKTKLHFSVSLRLFFLLLIGFERERL